VILADTSVWIDHLRKPEPRLVAALEWAQVFVHPFVVGELACGRLRDRGVFLRSLSNLPTSPVATDSEALVFLETRELIGRGIGWIDVHLLASATLAEGVRLWTKDRRLAGIARELDLAF
jgi:predicted nucleic acid-binding protein